MKVQSQLGQHGDQLAAFIYFSALTAAPAENVSTFVVASYNNDTPKVAGRPVSTRCSPLHKLTFSPRGFNFMWPLARLASGLARPASRERGSNKQKATFGCLPPPSLLAPHALTDQLTRSPPRRSVPRSGDVSYLADVNSEHVWRAEPTLASSCYSTNRINRDDDAA